MRARSSDTPQYTAKVWKMYEEEKKEAPVARAIIESACARERAVEDNVNKSRSIRVSENKWMKF